MASTALAMSSRTIGTSHLVVAYTATIDFAPVWAICDVTVSASRTMHTPLAVIPNTDESHRHLTARRGPRRGQRVPRLRSLFSISGQHASVPTDAMLLSSRRAQPTDQRRPTPSSTLRCVWDPLARDEVFHYWS
jgi:hypothetical protein